MQAINPGRRMFLKSLGALAALAAVPGTLKALAPDDAARLLAAMRSGLVEHQRFVLHEPIVLDFAENLEIRCCAFIAAEGFAGPMLTFGKGVKNINVIHCIFTFTGLGGALQIT